MAYAAVISLKHTIERLINPTNPQITESAFLELKFLGNTLKRLDDESMISIDRSGINALDAEIREAVCKVQDVLESYVLYIVHEHNTTPAEGCPQIPPVDEEGVEQEIDSFLNTLKRLKKQYNRELDNSLLREEDGADSAVDDFDGEKSTSVGLSDLLKKLRNELQDRRYGLQTVALVGMAGIGKSHLARKFYEQEDIGRYFELRAWVRVGPKDQIKDALIDIIDQIQKQDDEKPPIDLCIERDMLTLAAILQDRLHGKKYLIVLDDIWSTRLCNNLIWWLPADGKGRRLLLTTRLEEIAKHHTSSIHHMGFLNKEESWDLFKQNVGATESSLHRLEKVGRKIAENCEGLPLLIIEVANILSGLEQSEECWEKEVDKNSATFTKAYENISEVLFSSYEYLPQHLKACFLYMAVFPQSYEIPLPKLFHLWIVEDFFEPSRHHTLEDIAMRLLNELVSNSLVIVCKRSSDCRIKFSKLHSAYWYLCVKEARKNKFIHVLQYLRDGSEDIIVSQRRLAVQNHVLFGIKAVYESMAATWTARSLLCTGADHPYQVPLCFNLMLLKVLDALAIRFYEFPTKVLKLLQLRYLALTYNGKLHSSISNLRQLQCLIVRQYHNIKFLGDVVGLPKEISDMQEVRSTKVLIDSTCLPKEIWDMEELRHLWTMGSNLPNPSTGAKLPNLLTLHMDVQSCTEDVFRSIPYLKKLAIKIELQPDAAETLSCFKHILLLNGLESLKCVIANLQLRPRVVAPPYHLFYLPQGLKKLSLSGLGYSCKYLSAIGTLPKLEVLKLRCSAFQGPEWETRIGEFQSLDFLLLEDIDLVNWTIYHAKCFPRLRHLIIGHCFKLKDLPRRLEDIPALKTVEVVDCSPSVVASAQKLQKIKKNSSLQVVINSSWSL